MIPRMSGGALSFELPNADRVPGDRDGLRYIGVGQARITLGLATAHA
jgi:hypothetical protein